jgi:hypothetical protein
MTERLDNCNKCEHLKDRNVCHRSHSSSYIIDPTLGCSIGTRKIKVKDRKARTRWHR